jgi:hypothetical protein
MKTATVHTHPGAEIYMSICQNMICENIRNIQNKSLQLFLGYQQCQVVKQQVNECFEIHLCSFH